MEKILFLTTVGTDGSLSKGALETLQAAADLGGTFTVGLVGADVQKSADAISGCGAAEFLAVSGADFSDGRYSTDAAAFEALIKESGAEIILAPTSSRISRALPGAVSRLGGATDTRITGLKVEGDSVNAERWYYRQRMVGKLTRKNRPWALVLESGTTKAWSGDSGAASVKAVSVTAGEVKTKVEGEVSTGTSQSTIRPDAEVLFVAGAGWCKKQADGQAHVADAEKTILGFLNETGASLGSSKSLVDQSGEGGEVISYMSHLNQIGQTGSSPRHAKGLATCCHGEEPHVVGWRFVNERRAVNLNPNCGWAQGKADVLYVADAFEVTKKVTELLAEGATVSA